MSIFLVSSIDSHSRDNALERLRLERPAAAVVVHDLLEGERVLRRTTLPGAKTVRQETLLEHGCLGCTVRLDVLPTIARLLERGHRDLVVGLPPSVAADLAIASLAPTLDAHDTCIETIALAIDPAALEDLLWDRHTLWESGLSSVASDDRTAGEFLIRELQFADTVVLVEGLFAHLLAAEAPGCQSGGDLFARGARLAAELAPHASLVHPDADWSPGLHDPAAAFHRCRQGALNATGPVTRVPAQANRRKAATAPATPRDTTNAPFSTAVVHAERPLHPARFREALPKLAEATTWLRGTLWVANAPTTRIALNGVGPHVWLEHVGGWGDEAAGTAIALSGPEVDAEDAARQLAGCEMTRTELAAFTFDDHDDHPVPDGTTPPGGTA